MIKAKSISHLHKDLFFQQIMAKYESEINSFCLYYNLEDNEESPIYKEIVSNIWKSIDHLKDEVTTIWVYRVIVNSSLSYTWRGKDSLSISTSHFKHELQKSVYQLRLDREENLEGCLGQLSMVDRMLIILCLEGLNTETIAQVIGIPATKVSSKVNNIMTK
ncbi:hypothetical protein K5X82_10095 [Halosquirtibacter xylanolyticus]|uniref:RNA polymerase sigma factor n=1 Tax=Halosquirtibacter xylanolyticus TaxID=3374599 RepID=UPI0037484625|nr:hypothetical protein K5X82_10095 [Prolixibacteraceae bacterium]